MTWKMLSLAAAATVAAIGAASLPQAAHAEPHSYLLMCNGGGNMRAMIGASGTIQLDFAAGRAAGAPGAGECTWVDRAFRPGEPTVLAMRHNRSGAEYLMRGMLDDGRFFVHAYNDRSGHMIVTRTGP